MGLFDLSSLLITITALLSYANYRYLRLPTTIGLMLISLVISLGLGLLSHYLGSQLYDQAAGILKGIDFNKTLLHGMLSFLLFAGALHVNINDISKQKWVISLLASVGVILSTILVGALSYWIFSFAGFQIPFIYCLIFGALISPTDPIAVLAILKSVGIPKSLETTITGESLFNDGVGVVVFLVLLEVATGGHHIGPSEVWMLFLKEAVGGAAFGLVTGYVCYLMLRSVDDYQTEILLTLALVAGGYALCDALHISGPIAVVVSGLLIGNRGRILAMSQRTRQHLDTFYELIDNILNALLFVLMGFEVLVLHVTPKIFLSGLAIIPCIIFSRMFSVGMPVGLFRLFRPIHPHVVKILTWAALRGGISIALALSVPKVVWRDAIVTVTYMAVVFSIVVQGLTLGKFAGRLVKDGSQEI